MPASKGLSAFVETSSISTGSWRDLSALWPAVETTARNVEEHGRT